MQDRNGKDCMSVRADGANVHANVGALGVGGIAKRREPPVVVEQSRRETQAGHRRRGADGDEGGTAFARGAGQPDGFGAAWFSTRQYEK